MVRWRCEQLNALKVDGQFVRDINRCPENYAIIRAIVELARQLGISERTLRYRLAAFREAGLAVAGGAQR